NFACVEAGARWRGQPKEARQFSERASACVFWSSKMSREFRKSSKLSWSAPSLPWTPCGGAPMRGKRWQTPPTMPQSSTWGFPTVTVKAQEVLNLIEDDEDIAALVLAAATSKEGPGPLVSSLAKNAGDFPIPVAIVPGHLNDEELDALS